MCAPGPGNSAGQGLTTSPTFKGIARIKERGQKPLRGGASLLGYALVNLPYVKISRKKYWPIPSASGHQNSIIRLIYFLRF